MKKITCLILSIVTVLSLCSVFASAETTFSDVKSDRWSIEYINYAVEQGYMNGVGGGKFNPAGTTTRGMAVTVLWRLCGSEEIKYSKKFSDVPDGKWYTTAVLWAASKDIVNGIDSKTFAPDKPITREQLAAIMYRFATYDNVKTDKKANIKGYSDYSKVSSYAQDALAWCGQHGLISGVTKTELQPKGNATREQFSAIMYRYDHAGYKFPDTQTFEYNLSYNKPVALSQYTPDEYPLVNDADIYVATNGKDTNPGTLDKPVKTFEKAVELVRELKKTATDEIVVAFKAGEYGSLDITLTSEDSGTEAVPIKYCKYGDGDVVFNNGFTIEKDDFKPLSESEKSLFLERNVDKIYKVSLDGYFEGGLPKGITPFEGNSPCVLARVPDKDGTVDNYFSGCIENVNGDVHYPGMVVVNPMKKELDKCTTFEDMVIKGYLVVGYRVDYLYATGYDKATGILYFDPEREVHIEYIGAGLRTPNINMDKVYLENNPTFLSDDGEFWCDNTTNTLYVYNPTEDYNIGIGGKFITLDDADYVTITGLTFKNCYNENAITVKDSEHVTMDRVFVEGVTGTSTPLDSDYHIIPGTNSVLSVIGDSNYLTVTECEFSKFKNHGIDLFPTRDETYLTENHIVIDNNYFHDCGNGNTFGNQTIIDRSIGALITHNVFENLEGGALDFGTSALVEYNVFDNVMTSTQDYGCMYVQIVNGVMSRDNTVRYNIFNQLVQNGANYAIYLDDGATYMHIYGNIFYGVTNTAIVIHNSRSHDVHDNIFINSRFTINGLITCNEETGELLTDGLAPRDNGIGGGNWQWNGLYQMCMVDKVQEGEPGYEEWKAKFPDLYEYYLDYNDLYHKENLLCPYNEVYNNAQFTDDLEEDRQTPLSKYAIAYGNIHDNNQYSFEENPFFVDPLHGNYSLREDADFLNIPYELIGRY